MPHPVSSTSAVAEELLPLAGLVDLETAFTLCKPAQPEIKVSQLKPAFFFLPDNQIFMDKTLPESEPYFLSNIVPHPSSPTDFVDLHKRVYAPGPDYPEGTYNAKGARISLTHTNLNIPAWRHRLAGYYREELVDYLEYGFPIGVSLDGETEPCLKNHSSSYMFFSYLDKFCAKEITKGGLTGPFSNIPFTKFQISPMMTSAKKPSGRRPVFDASYGSSLNKITPTDHYLEFQAVYDFPTWKV